MFFGRFTNKELTPEEIQIRIERRIHRMRKAVDAIHGPGFFDKLASGEITREDLDENGTEWVRSGNHE